jgi:hypothetical protein
MAKLLELNPSRAAAGDLLADQEAMEVEEVSEVADL